LIFGSGDIWQASDIFAMIEQTGVAAVSVARGCIGNPWIFRQARELMAGLPPRSPTLLEQRDTLLAHLALAMSLHGEPHAARLMRKFGIRFSQHHPAAEQTKQAFIACTSLEAWHAVIAQSYPR
jgi:tRNA-dihydrouridine synthase